MSATVDASTGLAITFSSGFLASVENVDWSGVSRPAIPTSNMGTAAAGAGKYGNATYIPGRIIQPGQLKVTIQYNPDTLPPIASASETVTLTYYPSGGNTTGASLAATGFMVGFDIGAPLDDKMTAEVTIQLSGNITRTAGS